MKSIRISIFFSVFFLLAVFITPLSAELPSDEEDEITEELNYDDSAALEQNDSLKNPLLADDPFYYDDDLESYFFDAPDLIVEVPPFEPRCFEDIFPGMSLVDKRIVMQGTGLRYSYEASETPSLNPASGAGIDLLTSVLANTPSHIIQALAVIPYNERELDMLDIYNALGRVEKLKDHNIPLRNGSSMAIFKDTTRIISASNRKAIPDPPPADMLPYTDTLYLRFTDAYIGNLFIRGDMSLDLYGITYKMTNFRDINFTIFKIMKAEKVTINLYLEPIEEGILIYSVSGIYLPGFIIKRMNLTPNINARIRVLTEWITEGLREQESIAVSSEREQSINTVIHNNRINRINQMLRVD